MRSSASLRAAEGHGRNLDSALTSPLTSLFPTHPQYLLKVPNSIEPPHGEIKTSNVPSRFSATVASASRARALQKAHLKWLVRNLTFIATRRVMLFTANPFFY